MSSPRKTEKKKVRHIVRNVLLLTLLGLIMTVALGNTNTPYQFFVVGCFTSLIWIFLWMGNSAMGDLLESKVDWFNHPYKSLAVLFSGTIIYTMSVVFLMMHVFTWLTGLNFSGSSLTIYSATLVTIVISLFMHGRSFLINWKQTALDAEKLKRESVVARYENLKSQVNPHFLFNSLNALTSLVYEDKDKAVKFIKQLSDVYRYVLDTRQMEVVTIAEEIKFLESYLFLQQIRFGDNLKIKNELKNVRGSLPPLSLQMLIENAIKHNVISNEHPLSIFVRNDDNRVIVSNTLREKKKLDDNSSRLGLENISKRYEFLSNHPVEIIKTEDTFEVRLPILRE